jgi:cytochrome c556
MKKLALLAVVSASLCAPIVSAQMKPQDAIKHRKAAFNVIGYNFATLGAMVNGRRPYNEAEARRAANTAAAVAWQPYEFFMPGTDTGDTRAKPNIWTDASKFKAGGDKMVAEMAKLAAAAGNLDSLKVQFAEVGKTCKGCHDDYRKE